MPSAPTNVEVTETPGGRTRTLMESEVGSLTEIVTSNTLAVCGVSVRLVSYNWNNPNDFVLFGCVQP